MRAYRVIPWSLLLVLGALLPLRGAAAADRSDAGGADALLGTVWRLERIQYSDGKEIRPPAGRTYTVQFFTNGRLAGQADTNRIMGGYTVTGNTLSIGPLASTRVAIPPGSIQGEFIKALEQAASFRASENRLLVMLKVDSGTMTFTRPGGGGDPRPVGDAAAIAPLVGVWTLTQINGQAPPAGPEPLTIEFDARGAVSGSTGVNRYGTSADLEQLAEGRISLGQIASTRRAGPPDAMRLEREFLDAMGKVQVWKLSGRTLYLEAGDRQLLVFRRSR